MEHLINTQLITLMKDGVMLINTVRDKIIDAKSVLEGLKSGKIGYFGMDVYENEKGIYFNNFSKKTLEDNQLALLATYHNVLITAHQAFLTN